mmetsp:Transcript_28199/g.51872  ORF Transcript_28199/g.51872 Transcript_28199/m.51872 type:complete len:313 (-) Transcript_28199:62-1000(-)
MQHREICMSLATPAFCRTGPPMHYPQQDLHGRSEVPRLGFQALPKSLRKQRMIDFLMAHVDHDDLLRGILLIACSKGLPGAAQEQEAAFNPGNELQEAVLGIPAPPSQPAPTPQDASTANYQEMFGFTASPSPEEMLGIQASSAPPGTMVHQEVAPELLGATKEMEASIALTNAVMEENVAMLNLLMENSQSADSAPLSCQQPGNLQAQGFEEREAMIQAVMAENHALRQQLLAVPQNPPPPPVGTQQDGGYPATNMQMPLRPSLADLLPEPSRESAPTYGPATRRAAYEACQRYLPQQGASSSGALYWSNA